MKTETNSAASAVQIEAVEDARYQAMIQRDFEALDLLLAEEFYYHRASGKASTKTEFLNDLKNGGVRFVDAKRYNVAVHCHGTAATIMGSTSVQMEIDGHVRQQTLRYLNVWVFRDGRWQLAARQGSVAI